jgi:hypothetical protein
MSRRDWTVVVIGGIALGIAHALSPLSVWSSAAFAGLVWWAGSGLPAGERGRVRAVLVVGIGIRVATIIGLFLLTNHSQLPFGSLFGDEEYFIRRSIWMRNVALGIPIHTADLIYAFDEYSYTHYLYVMALLQALFGMSPYGLHMFSAATYIGGAVVLFRLARRAYGAGVALAGLIVLLFLPSLFAWSIAALKEPPYFLVGSLLCAAVVAVVQSPSLSRRVAALIFIVLAVTALQAIRDGGLLIGVVAVAGGWTIGWLSTRPRATLACAVLAPILLVGALSMPSIQLRAEQTVRRAARLHWGHINTAGYVYRTLDDRLYPAKDAADTMSRGESLRFLVRSAVDYVTVPQPWAIESRAALAFVPELMFWYAIVALAPIGFVAALRRDGYLTGVLASSAAAAAALVAITGGNVGTLIRHRGLALPYLVWLSAAGAAALITPRRRDGDAPEKDWHGSGR